MNKNNTVKEIKDELDELGVEYDEGLNKDELLKLLPEKQPEETVDVEEVEEPKKYVVIHDFKDLKDNDKIYIRGDVFPKGKDANVSSARIHELLGTENKIGKRLIKEQD